MARKEQKRLDKFEKVSYFTIPGRGEMIKLSCHVNAKHPIGLGWQKTTVPIKALLEDNCNVSLLTGYANDISVIDVDTHKMEKDNIFLTTFKKELKTFFDTFAVRSASGGLHLYFSYDSDLKQTQSALGVDIRNDGGHIVCPPSKYNGGCYEVINNVPTRAIPEKLKAWCLSNLKKKEEAKKTKKGKKLQNEEEQEIQTTYETTLTKEEFDIMLEKLPIDCEKENDFRGAYVKWVQILKACKFLGRKDEFMEWSKKTIHANYDENALLSMWQKEDSCIWNFMYLLKHAGVKNRFTFKRLPEDSFNHYKEINKAKLENIFKPGKNYLVKSDTGTGKTTSFKNYVVSTNQKFISITSRVSLSYEQCESFRKEGLEVEHYKDSTFEFGDNIVITPESSLMIRNFDFSNYVIFLDEFDSIINHVLTSDTLKNKRKDVFRTLLRMLACCDQFIAVDADISEISKRVLDFLQVDYEFYINRYKNYRNVKVHVLYDEEEFFNKVRSKEKYLLCSDSKTDTELNALRLQIDEVDLKVITSDTEDAHIQLDEWLKVLFSPKIIYGLDSTMRRTVFCHYKGHTISPSQMVQQLCRCRDVEEVYVFFSDIESKNPTFDTPEDTNAYYKNLIASYNIRLDDLFGTESGSEVLHYGKASVTEEKITELFNELFKMNAYKQDCYGTNKFLHFLNILKEKGLTIEMGEPQKLKQVQNKALKKELIETRLENFNPESLKVTKLNEYLRIPSDKLDTYKELFVDNTMMQKHFNISSFFFADQTDNLIKLSSRLDFDIAKCKDIKLKLDLLTKMIGTLKLDKMKLDKFVPTGKKLDDTEKLTKEYLQLFRVRKANLSMDIDTGMYKEVCNVYRNLFGIIKCKRVKFSKTHNINISSIDADSMALHKEIYNFRKPKKPMTNLFKQRKVKKMPKDTD